MSIQELLPLSSVRGHDTAVSLVYSIYQAVDNIKVYQSQCRDLGRRCGRLLLSLADYTRGLDPERMGEVADEVELAVARIQQRIQSWANFSRTRAFIKQNEVKQGVVDSYAELASCTDRFSMSLDLQPTTSTDSRAMLVAQDRDEIRGAMNDVLQDIGELKLILSTHPPEDAEVVMQVIQEELRSSGLNSTQERNLQNGLWELYQFTDRLPPMTDLTGQITRIHEGITFQGASHDMYKGKWLGRQDVSLWFPRNQTPVAQMLFQEQIGRWRHLDHPHVLRLYGTAFIDGSICSVSPWFDGQVSNEYLQNRSGMEKIRVLTEVASGMAYLHLNEVTHGNLRGANVMVSSSGEACISGYGLNEFFEETSTSNVRWQAPEIVNPSSTLSPMNPADSWSFAMLCLELMTGCHPFSDYSKDVSVAILIAEGTSPKRPSHRTASALTDELWALMERCWQKDPLKRPSLSEIAKTLERCAPESGSNKGSTSGKSSTYSDSPGSLTSASTSISTGSGIDSSSSRKFSFSYPSKQLSSSRSSLSSSSAVSVNTCSTSDLEHSTHGHRPPSRESHASPSNHRTSSSGAKGLFRIASLTRLRSRHKSSNSASESPTVPPLPIEPETPRSSSTFYSFRTSTSAASLSGLVEEYKSTNSSQTQSLSTALHDPEPIVKYSVDGSVEAGTLEGLVNRLFTDTAHAAEDVGYRYIFLASYRVFTSSEHLFGVFRSHFEAALDPGTDKINHDCAGRQYSILLLIKTWLQLDYEDMDERVLRIIRDFSERIKSSQTMQALSREVVSLIDQKLKGMEPSHSPSILIKLTAHTVIPRASEIRPIELAIALTITEGGLFSKITHFDCIAQLQRVKGVHRIEKAINTNTRVVNWVKRSILKPESHDARADVYKFFVNTAEECQKLSNFASMYAIVHALQSATLRRLVLTRDSHLKRYERNMLQRMTELLDPARNHRAYRTAIRDHKSHTVPWLGLHLHDLHAVLVGHPSVIEVDGRPLVNFARFIRLTSAIREVLQYKAPDLHAQQNHGVLAYLEQQLRTTPFDSSVDAFEQRSRALAEQEERIREQRLPELRALGFATGTSNGSSFPLSRTSTIAKYDESVAGLGFPF